MVRIKGALGPLERSVMDLIWDGEGTEVTVRDVLEAGVGGGLAYTTLMTVLDRLWRKGLLSRRRLGRAYVYRARVDLSAYLAGLVSQVLEGSGARSSVLMGFVKDADETELAELRAAIRQVERERRSRR